MEMGVNRGPPPGPALTQGYQAMPNQAYQQNYGDGAYYSGPTPQQGSMYRPNHPHMMSPNQGHPYHKQAGLRHQISPEQAQFLAKKQAYMNDCAQNPGGYNIQQPTPPPGMMFSPNGVSAPQTMHHSPGQARFMMQGHMRGHSPNQGQFPAHMACQGQMSQRMMWYQEPGMLSPPGGMPARFSGNNGNAGNRPIQMMSPPPQQMVSSSQQQMRHMMTSPGQIHGPGMSHMTAMTPRPQLQHYPPEQALAGSAMSPGYQQHSQHYQQYGPPQNAHVRPPSHGPPPSFNSPSQQQPSPGIPYSQALEGGYPSPSHTAAHNSSVQYMQTESTTGEYHNMLQTVLPAASTVHSTCVYTMANTQPAQNTTASTGTIMSGEHVQASTNTGVKNNKHQTNTVQTSQSCDSTKSHDCSHRNSNQSGVTEQCILESKNNSVDIKTMTMSSPGDELDEMASMQMSYSGAISKSEHSSAQTTHNRLQHDQRTAIQTQSQPAAGQSSASTAMDTGCHGNDKSEDALGVMVPFGWRRVLEDSAVVYYSPSQSRLCTPGAVVEYLITEGTCKCGLGCPLLVEKTFNFDPNVVSKDWSVESIKTSDDLNNLCNHKRKMIALATLQTTSHLQQGSQFGLVQQAASKVLETLSLNKKDGTKKKKSKVKSVPINSYDGMLVSQLLLHRDKMSRSTFDDGMKLNTSNSGITPSCDEIKTEIMPATPGVGQHMGDAMQMSPSCRNPNFNQRIAAQNVAGVDGKYMYCSMQGPGNMHQFNPNQRLHRPQNPFDAFMGLHQKGHNPEGHMMGHNQMAFGQQKGCMPPGNQMFSLQLQMQAKAAAARNASSGHRFGMPSPSLSSHSQESSPSPGQLHLHGKKGEIVNTPPPYFDQSSPSPIMGPYRTPPMGSCPNNRMMSPPHHMGVHMPATQDHETNLAEPPVKKKKKKKRKRDAMNKAMSGLLDKNMPCPNVDVRQFAQKRGLLQQGVSSLPPGYSEMELPSFMDNPAAFLAQQAEMMTNKLQSTFTEDVPMTEPRKSCFVNKEDSLEHLLGTSNTPYERPGSGDSATPHCRSNSTHSTVDEGSVPSSARETESTVERSHYAESVCSSDLGQSSQGPSSMSQPDVPTSDSGTNVMNHNPKEFPASCLLSAAARAQVVQPTTEIVTSSGPKSPSSWSRNIKNRFRFPSGPAPICHVPPGGQCIGGGSIVYHHKIENQQAFHEGGVVNGGGILMMSGAATKGDSFMVNCLPGAPLILQGAMPNKGLHLSGNDNSNMATKNMMNQAMESENNAVMRNLMQAGMQEQLQAKMAAMMTSKDQDVNPIQMVQNLISGIGGSTRTMAGVTQSIMGTEGGVLVSGVGDAEVGANIGVTRVNGPQDGTINGLSVAQLPRHLAMMPLSMAMPPMSVSAVTAVTDSITQLIPTAGSNAEIPNTDVNCRNSTSIQTRSLTTGADSAKHHSEQDQTTLCGTEVKQEQETCADQAMTSQSGYSQSEQWIPGQDDVAVPVMSTSETQTRFVSSGTLKTRLSLKGGRRKKKKKKKKLKTFVQSAVAMLDSAPTEDLSKPEADSNDAETGTVQDASAPASDMLEAGQNDQLISEEAEAMLTQYQDVSFSMPEPRQLVLGQSQEFHQQFIQAPDDDGGTVCLTSQGEGHVAIAQGQTTNMIQTLSFVPNMVGIDPSTGLVQSIHMPLGSGGEAAKDETAEQISPIAQTQVMQTVMQSLHIQNNVLVQGVSSSGVPGTFIQPLGAMGNTLIPIFPNGVPVASGSDEGSLSVMSMNQLDMSAGEPSQYSPPPKPSSNVVATQTEAVQTEDSCSDLMDPQGGGRLLAESEEGILADDSYILEEGEMEECCSPYAISQDVISPQESYSEQTITEQNSVETSPDSNSVVQSCSPIDSENTLSQSSVSVQCVQPQEDSLSSTDTQAGLISNQHILGLNCGSYVDPKLLHSDEANFSEPGSVCENLNTSINKKKELSSAIVAQPTGDKEKTVGSDSSCSATTHTVVKCDTTVHTDSASESMSMPVLSREGSIFSERLRPPVDKKITPAMTIIQTRLEHSIKLYQDPDLDQLDSSNNAFQFYNSQLKKSDDVCKEPVVAEKIVPPTPKEERFGEPPTLSAMTGLNNAKKRPFQKRKGRFKKKPKKIIRTGLHGRRTAVSIQSSTTRYQTDLTDLPASVEKVSLNNNQPAEIVSEADQALLDVLPQPITEKEDAGQSGEPPEKKEFTQDLPAQQNKMSAGSTGGSSDGEANQSSDSSQSMSTSEGDEVRCGNSPSIRCSNLLTSSPETTDLNCGGLVSFDKLEKICVQGGENHVRKASKQIMTRRSLRSELDNIIPRHKRKRSLTESEINNKGTNEDSSCSSSPDPSFVRSLCPGELIWGPFKTYPSWPGKLVAYVDVPKNPKSEAGKPWVRWFGFHTYSQVEPQELKTLTEGLEAHHSSRQKYRKGRKLNSALESAIQEAMLELDRQMEHDNQPAITNEISLDNKPTKLNAKKKKIR